MAKSKDVKISFEELMAELDKVETRVIHGQRYMPNDKQVIYIKAARKKGMPFREIRERWLAAGWPNVSASTLARIDKETK